MIIHRIRKDRYYGGPLEVSNSTKGIPLYTTRTAPPEGVTEGMYLIWIGNRWGLTNIPPPELRFTSFEEDSDLSLLGDSDSS